MMCAVAVVVCLMTLFGFIQGWNAVHAGGGFKDVLFAFDNFMVFLVSGYGVVVCIVL